MKKQVVIPAVVIAVLVATAFAIHFINFKTEIPNIKLVSLQLQLDKKNEEFVLNQFKGCTRGELVQKWGNPDGSLFGFYGDIWSITENESLVVYYSAESTVEHIKLHKNEKNN